MVEEWRKAEGPRRRPSPMPSKKKKKKARDEDDKRLSWTRLRSGRLPSRRRWARYDGQVRLPSKAKTRPVVEMRQCSGSHASQWWSTVEEEAEEEEEEEARERRMAWGRPAMGP